MTAIQMLTHSHIRKVNVRQDLLAVADLIEVCFSSTLDEDGRDYLRHLRWAARDFNYLSWLQGAAERIAAPLYGFVWEENGRIVGNLSLIPFVRRGHFVYLIANVAVHPDYRRNGIAHQLTQTALDYVRRRGVSSVWLQVRDDNPVAYHLYLSLGFIERSPPHHLAEQRQRHDPIKLASFGRDLHPSPPDAGLEPAAGPAARDLSPGRRLEPAAQFFPAQPKPGQPVFALAAG